MLGGNNESGRKWISVLAWAWMLAVAAFWAEHIIRNEIIKHTEQIKKLNNIINDMKKSSLI